MQIKFGKSQGLRSGESPWDRRQRGRGKRKRAHRERENEKKREKMREQTKCLVSIGRSLWRKGSPITKELIP